MGKDTPQKQARKAAHAAQAAREQQENTGAGTEAEEPAGEPAAVAVDSQREAAEPPAADPNRPIEVRAFAKQNPVMMRDLMRVLANGDPAAAAKLLQNDTTVLMSLPPRFYQACQQALFGLHPLHGGVEWGCAPAHDPSPLQC